MPARPLPKYRVKAGEYTEKFETHGYQAWLGTADIFSVIQKDNNAATYADQHDRC